MNWIVLVLFSSFGIVLGGISLLGLPNLIWWGVQVAAGVGGAYWLAKHLTARQMMHGFIIGFAAAMLATTVQVMFFDFYSAHNPSMATTFAKLPQGADPRQYLLSYAPVIGLVQGVAVAVFTWTASNVVKAMAISEDALTTDGPAQPSVPQSKGRSKNGPGKRA